MTSPGRAARAAAGWVVVLLLLLPAAAGAQEPELGRPQPASARLVVTDLQAVLGPGTAPAEHAEEAPRDLTLRVLVENDGTVPLRNLRVVVEWFEQVRSRSVLRQALDRGQPGGNRSAVDVRLRDGEVLAPGDVAGTDVVVTAEQGGWSGDGIWPVQVSVTRGTEILDRAMTAVVHLAQRPLAELRAGPGVGARDRGVLAAAVVWPIDTAPWRGPDGRYPAGVDAEIAPGGRLDRLLGAVEAAPDAGVLLAPAAHLLEDLADRADGFEEVVPGSVAPRTVDADDPAATLAARTLERIRAVAARLPLDPVAGPYADAIVGAMLALPPPVPSLAATSVADGRQRLRTLLDRDPDASVYLATTPLGPDALKLVGGDHLLLPWSAVEGPDLDRDPDLPNPLRAVTATTGRRLLATVADPYLTDLLAAAPTRHGVDLAAHRILVETAMVYLERPALVRPVLLYPPIDWNPDPRLPRRLLERLRAATWLVLTTPSRQAAVSARAPAPVVLAPPERALATDVAERLRRATAEVGAARRALPTPESEIDGRSPQRLMDQLLRVPSTWFLGARGAQARALVDDVQAAVDRVFGAVEVPWTARITLTSERGTIPVTLQRADGGPLRVRVEVDSRGSLRWPSGQVWEGVISEGTQTVSFDTVALGRGTFPVTVKVTDPAGARVLDEVTLSVRSTAIGGPALWAIGAIVLVLLLAGASRRRRPERPKLEVVG